MYVTVSVDAPFGKKHHYTRDKEEDATENECPCSAKENSRPRIVAFKAGYQAKSAKWDACAHEATQEARPNKISVWVIGNLLDNDDLRTLLILWSKWLGLSLITRLICIVHCRHCDNSLIWLAPCQVRAEVFKTGVASKRPEIFLNGLKETV